MLNFKSEWLCARLFPRKFTGGYPKNQFLTSNFTPRMVPGAHESIPNQVRIPNEGPKVLQVHPETLRESSWKRSGDHLRDLRNHEIFSFCYGNERFLILAVLRFWVVFGQPPGTSRVAQVTAWAPQPPSPITSKTYTSKRTGTLERCSYRTPRAGPLRGRRIREGCAHCRRPRKKTRTY